jgi:glycosyltransferase involved in cell wall biosynthesis
MPKVSVIITTYNQAHFISQAIESVLSQTYNDFELIIIDDGSTDSTAEIVDTYCDPRISYHWQVNQERSSARNLGLTISQAKYITFLDADDLYLPNNLASQSSTLDANPNACMVVSGWIDIDVDGNLVYVHRPWIFYPNPTPYEWLFNHITCVGANMIQREILERVGGFDYELRTAEDTHLWFKLIWHSSQIHWVHESVMMRRMHDANTIRNGQLMKDGHLKMLTKIYQLPDIERVVGKTKRQAYASAYTTSSFRFYAQGQTEQAKADLSRAIQLDSSLLNNDGDRVLNVMWSWANQPLIGDPIGFVSRIMNHLPDELCKFNWKKRLVFSGIWINKAFEAYKLGKMEEVKRSILKALTTDLGWIGNRGVVSIGIEAVIGRFPVRILRSIGKKLRFYNT